MMNSELLKFKQYEVSKMQLTFVLGAQGVVEDDCAASCCHQCAYIGDSPDDIVACCKTCESVCVS